MLIHAVVTRSILKKFPGRFQGSYAIFHSQQPYVKEPVSLLSHFHLFGFYFPLCLWLFKFLQHHSLKSYSKTTDLCTQLKKKSHRSLKQAVCYVYNLFALCFSLLPYTFRFPILPLGITARNIWGFWLTTLPLLILG